MTTESRTKRGRTRRIMVSVVVMLLVWPLVAWLAARALIVSAPLERADAIVVLSGSEAYIERTQLAANFYFAGRSPLIILTDDHQRGSWSNEERRNPYFVESAVASLREAGVPANRIEVLPELVSSTHQETLLLRTYASKHGTGSLLFVTSPYHSRRTLWTLGHVFRDTGITVGLQSVSPGQQSPDPRTWWTMRRGWRQVGLEYPKLIYYWFTYR